MAVRRPIGPATEWLEVRTLLAAVPAPSPATATGSTIGVVIDYSLDANHFFDTQQKRDLLQQAVNGVTKWFRDALLPLNPGGGDDWEAVFDNPATGQRQTMRDLSIGANEVVLFAGGRDMTDALGRGGPGGYNATGSPGWLDRVARRGQSGSGPNAPDFGPWGGAITFDTHPDSPWHFGASASGLGAQNDFLSVASHEMAHLFGFGTSDAWRKQVTDRAFDGPASRSQYDLQGATGVPLDDTESHWAEGIRDGGVEVAMDPQLTAGTRRLLTPLDYAGLDDVGWSMPPTAALSGGGVSGAGTQAHSFTVTYSHYAPLDASSIDAGDVTVIGPDGTVHAAALVSTGGGGNNTTRTATYSVAPPGGAWDAADSGLYSVVLGADQVRSTNGEAVAPGTLGTFAVDVAEPPTAELQPSDGPAPGAPALSVTVIYTDGVAVDASTLDSGDLLVTGPAGQPLPGVTLAAQGASEPATPITAVYSVRAPGGSWGPEDDGMYTVSLRPNQVADTSGNFAAAGAIGTFKVSLGAIEFDAMSPATYTDASGDRVTITLKGPGSGRVRFTNARPADAAGIDLTGTSAASSLVIKTGPAGTTMADISIDGSLKALTGKTADLTGDVAVSGSLGKLLLRNADAPGAKAVTIGAGAATTLTLASVSGLAIHSAAPVKALKVKGELVGADVRSASSIGKVTAGAIRNSRIFAGLADSRSTLPGSASDFVNAAATIAAVSVKSRIGTAFSNTLIAAPTIGRLSLGAIGTANNGAPFGVAADRIGSIVGIAVSGVGALKQSKLNDPTGSLTDGDFVVQLL